MKLYFATSNEHKFSEVKKILEGVVELVQLDIDLHEVQHSDPEEIVRRKLEAALEHGGGGLVVDDTSLHLDCLNGLPGPLVKWFLGTLGKEGIYELVEKYGGFGAEARTTVGYADSEGDMHFFEGSVRGRIVSPRGETFGWDPIFQPEGYEETYAEMDEDEKNSMSHRFKAFTALKDYLSRH